MRPPVADDPPVQVPTPERKWRPPSTAQVTLIVALGLLTTTVILNRLWLGIVVAMLAIVALLYPRLKKLFVRIRPSADGTGEFEFRGDLAEPQQPRRELPGDPQSDDLSARDRPLPRNTKSERD